MRDIKFRAFHKETKEMYGIRRIDFSVNEVVVDKLLKEWGYPCVNMQKIEIMQYTGRKDSEGKEIYEGDILQNEHHFKYQVVFKGDCWRCEPLKRNGFKNRFIGSDLKIIGNIYENKDLLED